MPSGVGLDVSTSSRPSVVIARGREYPRPAGEAAWAVAPGDWARMISFGLGALGFGSHLYDQLWAGGLGFGSHHVCRHTYTTCAYACPGPVSTSSSPGSVNTVPTTTLVVASGCESCWLSLLEADVAAAAAAWGGEEGDMEPQVGPGIRWMEGGVRPTAGLWGRTEAVPNQ